MKLERTGVVLYTENYDACVGFYRDKVGLPVLFDDEELTCFDFGGGYLMVEEGGVASPTGKNPSQNPTCLRLNVNDVSECVGLLKERGVEVDFQEHSWGAVAKFFDPDGNLCALRDEPTFRRQMRSDR